MFYQIGRYPLRLASDIRRVTAVDVQALYLWSDVIILPTVGFQSLASYLSGGGAYKSNLHKNMTVDNRIQTTMEVRILISEQTVASHGQTTQTRHSSYGSQHYLELSGSLT